MKKRGFTLIELLVAIAIMAVLIAIALPNFLGARERARDAKLKGEMNQLKSALRMYYSDYGKYPVEGALSDSGKIMGCGAAGTSVCPNTTASCTSFEFSAGGSGCSVIYMKKLPRTSTGEMRYKQLSSGDDFSMCTFLENTADSDGAASRTKCDYSFISIGTKNAYCVCSD